MLVVAVEVAKPFETMVELVTVTEEVRYPPRSFTLGAKRYTRTTTTTPIPISNFVFIDLFVLTFYSPAFPGPRKGTEKTGKC